MSWNDCKYPGTGCGAALVLCWALMSITACNPTGDSAGGGPTGTARGGQIFDENCGVCHGAGGRGPALSEIRSLPSSERRDGIRNHPIAGQIPQRLPANELADVIEFLDTK
jgi:mono/diheme cytochrome c family protein